MVRDLGGEHLPDEPNGYPPRVRLHGKVLSVAVIGSPTYIYVSMDAPEGDPQVMSAIAAKLDAALATGRYDALFAPWRRSSSPYFGKRLSIHVQHRGGGALLLLAVSCLRARRAEPVIRTLNPDDRLVLGARHLEGGLLLRREDAAIGGAAEHQCRHGHLLDVVVQARVRGGAGHRAEIGIRPQRADPRVLRVVALVGPRARSSSPRHDRTDRATGRCTPGPLRCDTGSSPADDWHGARCTAAFEAAATANPASFNWPR